MLSIIRHSIVMISLISSGETLPGAQTLNPEQAMRLLTKSAETSREYYDTRPRAYAMEVLQNSPSVDPTMLANCVDAAISDRRNPSRLFLLELSCERSNSTCAEQLLSSVHRFGDEYLGIRAMPESDLEVESRILDSLMMRQFLRKDCYLLSSSISDHRPLLEMLYSWLFGPRIKEYMPLGAEICQTIGGLPAPLALRKEYARRVLESYDFWGHSVPSNLVAVLDEEIWNELHTRLEESGDIPGVLPSAILQLIADRGELRSLEGMKRLERNAYPTEVLQGREPEMIPGTLSWRIRIQNPPATLLIWLRQGTTEDETERINQNDRLWIMRRAVEFGLESEAIREASLQYGSSYLAANSPWSSELPEFKSAAIELGVLSVDDLPEVAVGVPASEAQDTSSTQAVPTASSSDTETDPWKYWRPNEANYDVLVDWMMTINWDAISDEESRCIIREKMCELDLIHPDECADDIPTSQP